jgi:DNA-binding winged helix-turn-helix (wHTH) protein
VDTVRQEHTAGAVDVQLGPGERAVLSALVDSSGRVVDREQLRRDAGLADLSPRRCEAMLVGIRRALGPDAVVTVRRRGWRLNPEVMAIALAVVSTLG